MQIEVFSFFTWPRYQRITWSSGWDSPNVSHHSVKFSGHRHCVIVDIDFFHLPCDHVIQSSRDFEDRILPPQYTTLPGFLAIDNVEVQIQVFTFVMWPHNQKVKWHWRWGSSIASYYSGNCGGHRYCGRADIRIFNLSRDHVIKRSRDIV